MLLEQRVTNIEEFLGMYRVLPQPSSSGYSASMSERVEVQVQSSEQDRAPLSDVNLRNSTYQVYTLYYDEMYMSEESPTSSSSVEGEQPKKKQKIEITEVKLHSE